MNGYTTFDPAFESEELVPSHLPLDWNEDLSLEEYLDRLSDTINHHST